MASQRPHNTQDWKVMRRHSIWPERKKRNPAIKSEERKDVSPRKLCTRHLLQR